MNPNDRPYIEFKRTLNKGITARAARVDKDGKETRAGHPGEFKENWIKALVSHKGKNDPYSWVSSEWVMSKVKSGCLPVGYGNLDKLPADYPKEWLAKINDAIDSVRGMVNANREMDAIKTKLEAEVLELQKQVDSGSKDGKEAKSGKPPKSGGRDTEGSETALRETGQAAHV